MRSLEKGSLAMRCSMSLLLFQSSLHVGGFGAQWNDTNHKVVALTFIFLNLELAFIYLFLTSPNGMWGISSPTRA